MTQQELNKILDAHEMWLENSEEGERANLSNLDLRAFDFSGRKLNHIILRGADCTETNFRQSILRDADCTNTDFFHANLRFADFTGTTLTKTLLAGTILTDTKLPAPIVQIGLIGSREDYTVYHVKENIVQCGCWNDYLGGSLEEFAKRIDEVYPETSTEPNKLKDRSEYLAAIECFKTMRNNYLKEC